MSPSQRWKIMLPTKNNSLQITPILNDSHSSQDDISQLIQKVFNPPRFNLIPTDLKQESTSADCQQLHDLEMILLKITYNKNVQIMIPSHCQELFGLVSRYLIQPDTTRGSISQMKTEITQTFTCFNQLEIVHRIFLQLLCHHSILIEHEIDPMFLRNLAKQLNSPVKEVLWYVEKELSMLMSISCGLKSTIREVLLRIIAESIEEQQPTIELAPAIRLLNPVLQRTMPNALYRQFFVPLYSLYTYPTYASELHEITFVFVDWDVANADYCLKYLLTHWPVTHTQKEVRFLQQVAALLPHLSYNAIQRNHHLIMTCIARSLSSSNEAVAHAAIHILSNPYQNLMHMSKKGTILKELKAAIDLAHNHWSKAVCKEVDELILVLKCRSREVDINTKANDARFMAWKRVVATAHEIWKKEQ